MAKEKAKSQSLLNGALVLVVATVLVKVIGALFKIPLSMLIGEVGRGYFNTAYEIYTPLYSISMAGLPIAVSRMVAKERSLGHFRDVRLIRKVATRLFLMTGAIGTILMFIIAYPYTKFVVGYTENIWCVLAIAPSIFFCCCMSTFRGYYEGMQNMMPTAISQVIEALSKLLLGLGITYAFLSLQLKKFANLDNTKKTMIGNSGVEIYLPETYYVASGLTMEIYNSQITNQGTHISEYNVYWECEVGEMLGRKFSIAATD